MTHLKIDPGLKAFIRPLKPSERLALREALIAAGRATDPLTTWRGILIDGHNRYELCTELGLPFTTQEIELPSRDAVKEWMFKRQIARRNLTDSEIIMLSVIAGQPCDRSGMLTRAKAEAIVAAGKQDLVLVDGETIERAYRAIQPPKPPKSRAPVTASEPRQAPAATVASTPPAPTDIAAARARHAQRATDADVRELQRKLIAAEQAADFYAQLPDANSNPIVVRRSAPKRGLRHATTIGNASDWHVGEVVTQAETLGRNEYTLAIARESAQKYWENVLWLRADVARTTTAEDHLQILCGDMISGSIHPELVETNEVGLADQVDEALSMIEPGLRALAETCPRALHVACVGGNHSRITPKSQIKTGFQNALETQLYRRLVANMHDVENVVWHVPRAEGCAVDVMGWRQQIQHGTHIKSQGGVGGILVPLTKWCLRSASADYYWFGHFHQAECFGRAVVNGSLIGDSAYSKWLGLEFRPPEQVFAVMDQHRGLRRFERVSVRAPLQPRKAAA